MVFFLIFSCNSSFVEAGLYLSNTDRVSNSLGAQHQLNQFGVASLAENMYIYFKSTLKLVPVYLKFLKQI